MEMKDFLNNLGLKIAEDLERIENRYFTYHLPKNEDDESKNVKTIYFHEPILNNMQFYTQYPKGIRFGYTIDIRIDKDEEGFIYIIDLGFSIVHSKRIAFTFSKNFKDLKLQLKTKELISYLEKKGQYYSMMSVKENNDQKFIEINEEIISEIPKIFPIKEGDFRGSYFSIFYAYYDDYYDLESIITDHERLARDLHYYFSFLYKALFPKEDKKYRGTDQYRLLTKWFKKNKIKKQCEILGCEEFSNLEIHHIKSVSNGGKDVLENLICLCKKHHREVHKNNSYIKKGIYYVGENQYKLKDFTYNRFNKLN
ncbi:hypothetical protein XO12_09310 [Marinitoga sp. 1154]|uniref:HNH endonuclease signature motif containing protein n=1 Tax=Marinitoga sp. 1154 TaxID=1643335 RepID=UPI001586BB67|nr:HNH endonuclease signature motif containing protein [Marinitoga sp. 1154]NUV00277.1 hypothetical protein [Marinitoga sp. 1154]